MLELTSQESSRKLRVDSPISDEKEREKMANGGGELSSRLKFSTISKVPSAKSRLRQPVAKCSVVISSENSRDLERTTKSQAVSNQRVRPNSLPLKIFAPRVATSSTQQGINKPPTRNSCNTSILLKFTTTKRPAQNSTNRSSKTAETKTSTPTRNTAQLFAKGKATANRDSTSAIPSSEAKVEQSKRSTGSSLRNLVAIVRPQRSRRVNSSASATSTTSKPKLVASSKSLQATTTTRPSSETTTTTTAAGAQPLTSRTENGKVNLNHKDVNGREKLPKRESKQDENRICRPSRAKTDYMFANPEQNRSSSSPLSSLLISKTRDQNDQLPAVNVDKCNCLPSSCRDQIKDKDCDGETQRNNEQSNKHLFASTKAAKQSVCDKQQCNEKTNSCCNSNVDINDGAKSALTKSSINCLRLESNRGNEIDNRILPKPMGQQVLSLMMLDVGLLPADSQQQQFQAAKRSHVRLQSPESANDNENLLRSYLIDRKQSFSDRSRFPEKVCGSSVITDSRDTKQCNNYYSLQPTHEWLRMQVKFSNHNNGYCKSISLPSSPRIKMRNQNNRHRKRDGHSLKNNYLADFPLTVGGESVCEASGNNLKPFHDNLEAHSLSSSSCSSLNYCPPLLALSHHLNNINFEELLKSRETRRFDRADDRDSSRVERVNSNQEENRLVDQVTNAARQHELLTTALNLENHLPIISNDVDSSLSNRNEETVASNGGGTPQIAENIEQQYSQMNLKQATKCSESLSDLQSRRQQQQRSHSISGQEFHSNGVYNNLKHSIYVQPNCLDGYRQQNLSGYQLNHNSPSPYQANQNIGRSPSPLSLYCQPQHHPIQRESSLRYNFDRESRNHMHASLECLNTSYSENQRHSGYQQQQQYHHLPLQQHHQNPHYAASYVLAPTPANSVINQNGEQDLAAAAMGNPPSQFHSTHSSASSNMNTTSYSQSVINRALAQNSLRRSGLQNMSLGGTPKNNPGSYTSLNHPIRAGHSSVSLASSSLLIEDKLQNEIKKLQNELKSEKEKNEALSSQLNINSSLMSAFEQSLTTLNTRLRQLTTLNEKKDNEIAELREQLRTSNENKKEIIEDDGGQIDRTSEKLSGENSVMNQMRHQIEDLKRQLIEKDRLLTDTRLEALSAAHQLEQLESKMSGEHSLLANEDDYDEGVMVVNHSPSDSDAITDSAHFSESNNRNFKSDKHSTGDNSSFNSCSNNNQITNGNLKTVKNLTENRNIDEQSNHSSDYQSDSKLEMQNEYGKDTNQFNNHDSSVMGQLMESLLLTN